MSHSIPKVKKYGADYTGGRPIEERRWGVKVLPKNAPPLFVVGFVMPRQTLPIGPSAYDWTPPPNFSIEDLRGYFHLSEAREKAMLFESPNDAFHEAVRIEEVGIDADCFEVDPLDEVSEVLHKSK